MEPIIQIHMNKNENLYGPSPLCLDVLNNLSLDHLTSYSRDDYGLMERAIFETFNIPKKQIMLGYGAEDILKSIFENFVKEGDKVALPDNSWWYYEKLAKQSKSDYYFYPVEKRGLSFVSDIDTLIENEKKQNSKVVLVCSPNNPTGNLTDFIDIVRLLEVQKEGIVLFDEAYWGYTDDNGTIHKLINKYPNFMSLRTFSKFFALAGIRIGFALCGNDIRDLLNYNERALGFNRISEELAVAALNSMDYYQEIAYYINEDREMLFDEINMLDGFTAYKSYTNFILIKIPNVDLEKKLDNALRQRGILVKFFTEPKFKGYARISIGKREHNLMVLDVIKEFARNTDSFISVKKI